MSVHGAPLRSIRAYTDGYCSQKMEPPPPIHTIEEGVQVITDLLGKDLLCRHDVNTINRIYRTIDRLEQQADQIPESNSHGVLESVIKRLRTIAHTEQARSKDLISLYYLQEFSNRDLAISLCFSRFKEQQAKNWNQEEIAKDLPCCYSAELFDRDIAALIGRGPAVIAEQEAQLEEGEPVQRSPYADVLDQKREAVQRYETTKVSIAEQKAQLEENRAREPQESQKYPFYLDELLDDGYLHLYDHLVTMRACKDLEQRTAKIQGISFSSLSHVVLEVREAIIRKVEASIPAGYQNVVFLLGSTRTGKSTALCFLRGDRMEMESSCYKSKDDRGGLIGHKIGTSCTFLPATEVIQTSVFVDFPGFDDTNGQVVSLGMEFALKALIKKYSPQILVFHPITGTEGDFVALNQLVNRLKRLLNSNANCILGVTKYSQNAHFKDIKRIEETQRQELQRLQQPTGEESKLSGAIEMLEMLGSSPEILSIVQQKKEELQKLQQERKQKQQGPLPDTEEKTKCKELLTQVEQKILQDIGLARLLRFRDLEDPSQRASCLQELAGFFKGSSSCVRSQQVLGADAKDLLEARFEKDLKGRLKTEKVSFKDIETFEREVLESSLVKTVSFRSNPEIGEFLHLPEMDPRIVREFDKKIVVDCFKNYMNWAAGSLNMALVETQIKSVMEGVKTDQLKANANKLKASAERLQKYISGLAGLSLPSDKEQAKKVWDPFQQECKEAADVAEFQLPAWVRFLRPFPLLGPFIASVFEERALAAATVEKKNALLEDACKRLDDVHKTLQQLKSLEKIVEKQLVFTVAFGKEMWATYFGDVGEVPPLPPGIGAILESPCPFWPGKQVFETHMLTLIPASVRVGQEDQPLTMKLMGELVKAPKEGSATKYRYIVLGEYVDPPVERAHWVLMTRDVLEDTRAKPYVKQKEIVEKNAGYEVPTILDATVSIFVEYVRSGLFLYGQAPWTFTRCQEEYKDYQVTVGGFIPAGLHVAHDGCSDVLDGVGAQRKFRP